MNSATLIGQLVQDPELRYTNDQKPVCTALFQFTQRSGAELTAAVIKIVGWGKKADELQQLSSGHQVCVEGSLRINTIERPEGFKESRAELNISNIIQLGSEPKLAEAGESADEEEFPS